ncbi:SMI1/KNR4 family protein [Micromonospora sp. CPCC 206061]|uniref:SMI1/KNR4 family protein n=1 Tax=Micromonospora sp. CPCC 206061 TaxID=3122410 RepID=UPI002FF0162D
MEIAQFDVLVESLRRASAASLAKYGFPLIEGLTVTGDEVTKVETRLGVALPEKYKAFMVHYGGGMFGTVDLFPISRHGTDHDDDLASVNDREFPDRTFIAVAPVGTGDHWGFPVTNGQCHDEVWFRFHDVGDPELHAVDFLEFVARHGLRA